MNSRDPHDSSSPSGSDRFATTRWSIVLHAADRSTPEGDQALQTLCGRYWYPLYAYVRRRGYSAADARDLTQDFFLSLLEKNGLQVADPERGRFRSFLLVSLKNLLAKDWDRRRAQKRGGDRQQFSIDLEAGEKRYQYEPADNWTPEKIFERRWALTLLEEVLQQLAVEYQSVGRAEMFECCRPYLVGEGPSYDALAATLNTTAGALRVAVHRLRERYRELLRTEVAATLADPAKTEDELDCLRQALRGPAE